MDQTMQMLRRQWNSVREVGWRLGRAFCFKKDNQGKPGEEGIFDQRQEGEKMSHRVFQIRKGADTKAEMMQVLPTSGNLDIVIHKGSAFGQEKEHKRAKERCVNREGRR